MLYQNNIKDKSIKKDIKEELIYQKLNKEILEFNINYNDEEENNIGVVKTNKESLNYNNQKISKFLKETQN